MKKTDQLALLCIVASLVVMGVRGQVCSQSSSNPYTKQWTIAMGHDWGAYEYINEGGYITGFMKTLIDEVCKAANINCQTVWLPYTACWKSEEGQHSTGGEGLLAGWIDACTGWQGTTDRIHVFDISMPFLKQEESSFYTKKGASFTMNDVNNKKIGFLDGWAADEKCLLRHVSPPTYSTSYSPKKENIKYFATPIDLAIALRDSVVDLSFSFDSALSGLSDEYNLEKNANYGFHCAIVGHGMMTRKDNDFLHYWNIGFMKIRNNGHFKNVCKKSQDEHGGNGQIMCVDT